MKNDSSLWYDGNSSGDEERELIKISLKIKYTELGF